MRDYLILINYLEENEHFETESISKKMSTLWENKFTMLPLVEHYVGSYLKNMNIKGKK